MFSEAKSQTGYGFEGAAFAFEVTDKILCEPEGLNIYLSVIFNY